MSQIARPAADEPAIDAEALKKAEQFIEAEEGASNKLRGALGIFVSATAVVMSLFHLYTAYAIVPTQVLRPVHVGFVLFLLILEGMRRASGWVMPLVVASFVHYALFGEQLPGSWAHRSYEVGRLVGHLYMTLEGIFGVAVDVSSSLIILFTI